MHPTPTCIAIPPATALRLRAPDGEGRTLAVVEGHLRWGETFTAG